jgi:hypothetical protein
LRTGPSSYLACIALTSFALAAEAAEVPVAAPAEQAPAFSLRKLEWTGTPAAAAAHVVDVFNPFGDIRLRPSESPEIVASGTVQELVPDQPRAELAVTQQSDSTTLRVVLPEGVEAFPGRVDLVVLLPTWVDVRARTTEGSILMKSIRGRIDARSSSGKITATFKKLTRGEGERGDSAVTLETDSGDIEAGFLVDTDLRVHITTGGVLQSQVPNDLVAGLRQYKGILTGSLGSGRHAVTIRSATGTVGLLVPNAKNNELDQGGKG